MRGARSRCWWSGNGAEGFPFPSSQASERQAQARTACQGLEVQDLLRVAYDALDAGDLALPVEVEAGGQHPVEGRHYGSVLDDFGVVEEGAGQGVPPGLPEVDQGLAAPDEAVSALAQGLLALPLSARMAVEAQDGVDRVLPARVVDVQDGRVAGMGNVRCVDRQEPRGGPASRLREPASLG